MSEQESPFVETQEYRRFAEFCEACRRYRYIGLCFGPPGVGKTLSARRYAERDKLKGLPILKHMSLEQLTALKGHHKILYTASVVNTAGMVEREIQSMRGHLHAIQVEPINREEQEKFEQLRLYERQQEQDRADRMFEHDWLKGPLPEIPRTMPTFLATSLKYDQLRKQISDPTDLILIDEADRLKMASLESARAIFDRGGIGLVLIGMPGMEKRLARYPQFYSRIGFVHQFRPLATEEVRQLLSRGWLPSSVQLPSLEEEAIVAIIRITGGNFRLLDRLLAQTERIVQINNLSSVTRQAIEAARESLVIGQL